MIFYRFTLHHVFLTAELAFSSLQNTLYLAICNICTYEKRKTVLTVLIGSTCEGQAKRRERCPAGDIVPIIAVTLQGLVARKPGWRRAAGGRETEGIFFGRRERAGHRAFWRLAKTAVLRRPGTYYYYYTCWMQSRCNKGSLCGSGGSYE